VSPKLQGHQRGRQAGGQRPRQHNPRSGRQRQGARPRGGEDALKGGDGRDEIFGQEDNDRVKGSFGRDRVYGGPGNDLVRGGTAHQTNDGARDVLDCGDGTDTFDATPGVDVVMDYCETPFTP
jgi:Ca2+-binding RTX toxin-like protein